MASDSVRALAEAAAQVMRIRPRSKGPARPILAGVGLDRPFFDDKNRAFWVLQSIGWSGYFILRSLSGLANSMGAMFVVHTLLLTATGYSLTLLMASLYRRLIAMRAIWTVVHQPRSRWCSPRPLSRSSKRGAIATFLRPDAKPAGVEYLGAIILDFSMLAAWSALYYGINYYLLLEEEIDQRAQLESQASTRAAGDAALPAQPAFPVQHAEQHLDAGAAEADRARQRDAVAVVVLPALHAGQRADRARSRWRRRWRR